MDMLRNVTIIAPDFAPFYCDTFNVAKQQHPDNAILPAWREGFAVCSPAGQGDWKAKTYLQQNVLQPMMNAATPDGSIYGNEASYLFKD
jgi:hypothetical protein